MSSASAAIPMGSGAPNAIRGRDRAPSVQATGNPASAIAANQPSVTSRCGCVRRGRGTRDHEAPALARLGRVRGTLGHVW